MEYIDEFVSKNKGQFSKYKSYIQNNNWTDSSIDNLLSDSFFNDIYSGDDNKVKKAEVQKMMKEQIAKQKENITYRTEEFKLQNGLIENILEMLKRFVSKSTGYHHTAKFKKFIKFSLDIVKYHIERVDAYVDSVDISKIESQEVRGEEIKLIKECYKQVNNLQDKIESLGIKDEANATSSIEFYNNMKAPLSMHSILVEIYPEIQRKLDSMNIDFDSPPDNTMLIHNPNPPKWDTERHYFEQEKNTLQFYVDEFKKLRQGIVIDGYYISPWMYHHLNVFVTPVPESVYNDKSGEWESKDKIKNPPLRDNEVMIFENYENAKKQQLMMFIAATRRAAKTTVIASHLDHGATIGLRELLCAGGSAKDLGQIAKNFRISALYKNPAFAVPNVSSDWTKEIQMGIKDKQNKSKVLSTLFIVNLDAGGDKKSEVLAGFTPDLFVLDEVMKAPFIDQLEGLKPALNGADGKKRCTPILSGTGGNESLSKDALSVLNFPENNDVLPMNYEILERGIPKDLITWEEDKAKSFGTFIPAQMNVFMVKYDSNLADYLGKPECKELAKIKLRVTDWKKSLDRIEETREKKIGNKSVYTKELVYHPIKPSEIFLSGKENPFPVAEAKAHKEHLLRTGLWDRRRVLYKDSQGQIQVELTTKELAPYPHKGGNIDAPFLIFEDPPKEKVKWGTYTGSFDDVKHDDSDSDSISTFYVWKCPSIGDPFSDKPVASLSFRPTRHAEVHEKWLMLMEAYQLEGTVFPENEDMKMKDFLDRRHLTEKYLASSLDFSQSFNLPNNLKRKFGWQPQTSKKTLFNLFVEMCNESFFVEDDKGEIIEVKGVQRIDDIGLLDEIINWTENSNTDRIISAMGAYGYRHYLVSSHRWKVKENQQKNKENSNQNIKNDLKRKKSFYGNIGRERKFYRK